MAETQLVRSVSERTDLEEADADDAIRAVLGTLGERLSEDQATDLAAQLPGTASEHLTAGESGQRFSEAEFISRIDQRLETSELTGNEASTAVITEVLAAADEDERAAVVDQFDHYGYEEVLAGVDVDAADWSPREE